MKKRKRLLAFVALALTLIVGWQFMPKGRHKMDGKVIVCAVEAEYPVINPVLDTSDVDILIFRGLMKFDQNNVPQKDIAKSYTISRNGLVYVFKIRVDVKFHDGTLLTAHDVAFTINSILNDKIASKKRCEYQEIESVQAINNNTVKVVLKSKFPPILDRLTIGIIPKHLFDGKDMNTTDFNHKPVGCGPYMYYKWKKGRHLELREYKEFYGGKPSINTLIFKFIPDGNVRALQLRTGEANVSMLEPGQVSALKKLDKLRIYKEQTSDYRCMLYNLRCSIWKDAGVRKAFNYAIDRDAIVKGILFGYGVPAYSPIQMNVLNTENVPKYNFDIDKAQKLLDEAGWCRETNGIRYKDGKKLSFKLTAPITDQVRTSIANYLCSAFSKIGADVKLEVIDWGAINIAKCDAFVLGWGSPYDADDHTYKIFHSSQIQGGYNFGVYANAVVDKLLERGRKVDNLGHRKRIYKHLQQELFNDPPCAFIAYLEAVYGVDKNILGIREKILGHHGAGFLWNVEEWDIAT